MRRSGSVRSKADHASAWKTCGQPVYFHELLFPHCRDHADTELGAVDTAPSYNVVSSRPKLHNLSRCSEHKPAVTHMQRHEIPGIKKALHVPTSVAPGPFTSHQSNLSNTNSQAQ